MSDATASTARRRPLAPLVAHPIASITAAVLLLFGVPFVLDVAALGTTFAAVEASLTDVRTALAAADLEQARAASAAAVARSDEAAGRVDGPVWWILSKVPRYGASAEVGRAAGALAVASSRAAQVVTDGGETLFDDRGNLRVEIVDGQVDLDVIAAAGEILERVPLAQLHAAVARLEATRSGLVPGFVHEQRRLALDAAKESLADVETATLATEALPGFLGADGTRTYLLAFENPAELRGTGGFLGFLGTMSVTDGKFAVGESVGIDPLRPETGDGIVFRKEIDDPTLEPVEAPDWFAARYDGNSARTFFANVNLDPDFPTVAQVMLDLWEDRVGDRLDGVIAIDPVLLTKMLEVTGPLDLPDAVAHPQLPDPIPADLLVQTILTDAYDVLGGDSPQRTLYHQAVAQASFATLFGGDWEPSPMLTALSESAAGRHLRLFSRDEREQALWSAIHADGYFGRSTPGADFLGVSANNTGANKSDVHVEHAIDVDYDIVDVDLETMLARRRTTATIGVTNNLDPFGHDPYIIRSSLKQPVGSTRVFLDEMGLNRTWFTVWTPGGTVTRGAFEEGELIRVAEGEMRGMYLFDHQLTTSSHTTTTWSMSYETVVHVRMIGGMPTISLDWIPPTTASPLRTSLEVTTPDGWSATAPTLPTIPARDLRIVLRRQ